MQKDQYHPVWGHIESYTAGKEKRKQLVGDEIQKGQVVCVIEAMKLMNEIEVTNAEKQLWTFIHSKGLLQTEVHDLYLKGWNFKTLNFLYGSFTISILMNFIKELGKLLQNSESTNSSTLLNVANLQSNRDCHMERFKVFLSEATEFYQYLITKLKRRYVLPEDPFDLARYRELCKKLDFSRRDWSVATTYYFKATLVWLDSGNPQNQLLLALLATYVGDDYIAQYHCIRSLAIKQPFRDAWDNLILLFEKNRSSHLHSLSKEAHFNFSIHLKEVPH
ncbi:hypothetical protein HYC85_021547 [Camellia sinensis]|uniref:Biotin carboxyl carrier protein of acetyl-CoA carboxylase n=1 Tax=Camellia sinensis TaxID=4442 RepID=A0A7J7GHZ1_CAMSI|nr:hypothetical protein HYC85_021547 [Camellia sinensis]